MWNLLTFFCMLFGGLVHFSFLGYQNAILSHLFKKKKKRIISKIFFSYFKKYFYFSSVYYVVFWSIKINRYARYFKNM